MRHDIGLGRGQVRLAQTFHPAELGCRNLGKVMVFREMNSSLQGTKVD